MRVGKLKVASSFGWRGCPFRVSTHGAHVQFLPSAFECSRAYVRIPSSGFILSRDEVSPRATRASNYARNEKISSREQLRALQN